MGCSEGSRGQAPAPGSRDDRSCRQSGLHHVRGALSQIRSVSLPGSLPARSPVFCKKVRGRVRAKPAGHLLGRRDQGRVPECGPTGQQPAASSPLWWVGKSSRLWQGSKISRSSYFIVLLWGGGVHGKRPTRGQRPWIPGTTIAFPGRLVERIRAERIGRDSRLNSRFLPGNPRNVPITIKVEVAKPCATDHTMYRWAFVDSKVWHSVH
jgi:hypothetical protein